MRGDPVKGLPVSAWTEALAEVDRDTLLRAAIEVVKSLLIQEWADRKKQDRRPQEAVLAAEAWLASRSPESITQAKAAAKACTAARSETFGYEHRIPEAARNLAWAVTAKDNKPIFEAFSTAEEELLARIALTAEYHRGPEQRRAIVETIWNVLAPKTEPVAAAPAVSLEPVPYSPESHFVVGQRITHKKFGELVVAAAGETWIEVELPDGTKKRLAHKP